MDDVVSLACAGRRRTLRALAGGGAALSLPAWSAGLACAPAAGAGRVVPGAAGFLGRLEVNAPITLVARQRPGASAGSRLMYAVRHRGRDYVNPTLVVRSGAHLHVQLDNRLSAPTSVHWHGLVVDTANDGGATAPVPAGGRYAYAFEVRNRAGLYWYHPHPHGATAGQVHDGLFGVLQVEDDDEAALRTALDLVPGVTELTLVLRDTDGTAPYAPTLEHQVHGYYGDAPRVNGVACAPLDVATRLYRLRLLNACNARTLLVGFRNGSTPLTFRVIGTDGGLLPAAVDARAAFLGASERLDLLLDLSASAPGDAVVLETRAFDPMHADVQLPVSNPPAADASGASEVHAGHGAQAAAADDHGGHASHGEAWPEGAPRDLLTLHVRRRERYERSVPSRLAAAAPLDLAGARERPFRLGYKSGHWRINDRTYAMGETPIEVSRDNTEVWLLRNYHTSMPHVMHLHGFAFEVLERETPPDAVRALAIDDRLRLAGDLGRKDSVLVWPGESVRVGVRFAMPWQGAQTYLFHCHNLEHEDGGMMLGVRVS